MKKKPPLNDETKAQIHADWLAGSVLRDLAQKYGRVISAIQNVLVGYSNSRDWRNRRMSANVTFLIQRERPANADQEQEQALRDRWYKRGEDDVLQAVSRARRAQREARVTR
jgi:transposase